MSEKVSALTEKPKQPESISPPWAFTFHWPMLRSAPSPTTVRESDKDFGKEHHPGRCLCQGKLFTYRSPATGRTSARSRATTHADGAARRKRQFRLHDTRMHILSNFSEHPPTSSVGIMICNGCGIYGGVSIPSSPRRHGGKGAVVRDSILLPESTVGEGACVERTILNERLHRRQRGHRSAGQDHRHRRERRDGGRLI